MATAADVPGKFDVVIDGNGYVFDDSIDPSSVYSSRQRAQFGLSPIFIQRQNVQGDYGDEQQDFFLTFTQRDWSEGEQQRYFRQADDDSKRRYWAGSGVRVSKPGQVSMRQALNALTFGAAVNGVTNVLGTLFAAGTTNLFSTTGASAPTDLGAHGLGAAPGTYGVASDGAAVYLGSEGTTKIRKYVAATFSDFAPATGAGVLAYLNNTLYGYRGSTNGDLVRWDTAGALTSLFTWKGADGTVIAADTRLLPFGGKLAIIRGSSPPSLWIYDGSGVSVAASLDGVQIGGNGTINAAVVFGQIFLGCTTDSGGYPAIVYYANGTIGELWRADSPNAEIPLVAPYGSGLVFTDPVADKLMYYNPATGGSSSIADLDNANYGAIVGVLNRLLLTKNATAAKGWAGSEAIVSSSSVSTSLTDFDSSLTKNFHGVRVEFDAASDGNGGSVDVAYRVGDVDGSYTSLATGVTSGTEILFSGVSGKSISIKVTLNKGTSTNGPVLKRISLRASALQPQYALARYTLALYGTDRTPEPTRVKLRDDTYHTKTGAQMAADLKASAARTTPSTITDEYNGTFTAILNPEDMAIDRIHVGEFRAQLTVRAV